MIVAGYTMDLYCDHPGCGASGEFYGQTYGECKRDAKARGFTFPRGTQEVYCKNHKRRGSSRGNS